MANPIRILTTAQIGQAAVRSFTRRRCGHTEEQSVNIFAGLGFANLDFGLIRLQNLSIKSSRNGLHFFANIVRTTINSIRGYDCTEFIIVCCGSTRQVHVHNQMGRPTRLCVPERHQCPAALRDCACSFCCFNLFGILRSSIFYMHLPRLIVLGAGIFQQLVVNQLNDVIRRTLWQALDYKFLTGF